MSDPTQQSRTECLGTQAPQKPVSEAEVTTDGLSASSVSSTHPMTPAAVKTLVGNRFGDYELVEEIARGGMGVVYKARQTSLGRMVALKMILEGQLASEQAVQRFYQEARAAAALDHPCIVPIYEIGQCDGRHFFTMAFIEGTTLSAQVRMNGVPAPRDAAALLLGVADAVDFAHRHGVIHRDLKPDNVLLDKQGRPRVTDFSLAKHVGGESGLTSAGQILGTPAYMAPEQAWGKVNEMGPATDIYALGGILYFLLTGRAPFEGQSTMEVLSQVTNKPPTPPHQLMPGIPPELEAVCLKCLEKERKDRYASAADLVAELRSSCDLSLSSFPVCVLPSASTPTLSSPELMPASVNVPPAAPAVPARSPRRRRGVLVGMAVLALALGGGGTFLARQYLRPQDNPPETPPPVTPAPEPAVFVEPARNDFNLKVEMLDADATDRTARRLTEGKLVRFKIEVERDAYVGLWNIAPDGTMMQLFPSSFEEDNLVQAGKPRVVPGAGYKIEAEVSTGMERVWVVASTKPWDPVAGERDGPFSLFKTPDQKDRLERNLRGLRLRPTNPKEAHQISESALRYMVVPREQKQ